MKKIGKWSIADVPHKGWYCVDVEDLGESSGICEMCELQKIRFVHYMQHDDYDNVLACGCDCAGHMQENYALAKYQDEKMRKRAGKRKRWLNRNWRISAKGNEYVCVDGVRYIVRDGFSFTLVFIVENKVIHSKRLYKTLDAAKMGAFDAVTWIQR